jgi:hypothetical protein
MIILPIILSLLGIALAIIILNTSIIDKIEDILHWILD